MDESVRRRLDSISRQILPPQPQSLLQDLHSNVLSVSSESVASPPVIIGGMVMDIHAKPSAALKPATTTPGKVQYMRGGVARNIAECMSLLGTKPFIISIVGLDMAGKVLLEHWESAGLSSEGIRKLEGVTTPVVSNIFDADGEVAVAVASVEAVETFLTPDWIRKFRYNICSAPFLIVDANLAPQTLEAACQLAAESGVPVWFEPVSILKSRRISSVVSYVTSISPNVHELISMANALSENNPQLIPNVDFSERKHSIESSFQMLKPAISLLLEKGIKWVVVTLGSDGVLLCSKEGPGFLNHAVNATVISSLGETLGKIMRRNSTNNSFSSMKFRLTSSKPYCLHFPALPAMVASLTGAGDCLVGGTLASVCAGLDIVHSLAVGIAFAKLAVETESNVPSHCNVASITEDAKKILFAVKELAFNR
ncbi:hypothetical protein QJS04_geneDACA011673 [Acorus gramineus]|uniref:Carbohydrate kinase PfkB domain-containing protein n=1 Tax=Acorus gramineus TaxID=55184 RepID=A0AAV9BGR1_ACOGR|nr:hypothetical protein QJS04_geneDACA011673 [Acorus gramineus]